MFRKRVKRNRLPPRPENPGNIFHIPRSPPNKEEKKCLTRSNPMILVVGGLNGFVGSNTTDALVQEGMDCVVTQHKNAEVPRFLEMHRNRHVFIEPADATSISDLKRIGERYKI